MTSLPNRILLHNIYAVAVASNIRERNRYFSTQGVFFIELNSTELLHLLGKCTQAEQIEHLRCHIIRA